MSKPSIPKGTRDFLPEQKGKRNFLFNSIEQVFQLHGFLPIETPAVELLSTLTGKYGDEGDKLLFKILDSGDYLKKVSDAELSERNTTSMIPKIAEKGLRYDLTVPFARFVVQHQNDIAFPFRRYQIQPVWRADRPQKGRYREFYQCDVDVVGSDSLTNEAELIEIISEVFESLGLERITLALNNRKILAGIAESFGMADKMVDMTVAIDKLDKIGPDKVAEELIQRGFDSDAAKGLLALLSAEGDNFEKLDAIAKQIGNTQIGAKGIEEMRAVLSLTKEVKGVGIDVDFSLARGLSYYTGTIFEVKADDFPSSICGGGRYDDLTGIFGMKDVSGVGISFGADRIYDLMEERIVFPSSSSTQSQVFFVNFGEQEALVARKLAGQLRKIGVGCEVFPEPAKMKKQMKFANHNHFPFVVMIGSEELASGNYGLKDMATGESRSVTSAELIAFFQTER